MNAKIILVILHGSTCDKLSHQLIDAGFRVTEFSSTGGFLRRKSMTLIVGVAEEEVEKGLALIRSVCPSSENPDEHNATIFVLDAEQFLHI
jgi:uncharacterized protein YaaQ